MRFGDGGSDWNYGSYRANRCVEDAERPPYELLGCPPSSGIRTNDADIGPCVRLGWFIWRMAGGGERRRSEWSIYKLGQQLHPNIRHSWRTLQDARVRTNYRSCGLPTRD